MKNYIPKSKGDIQAIEYLKSTEFEIVRPDVPELLEWMQDMNWEVGRGIAEYLTPHINDIKDELLSILGTNDEIWKYWIINSLIANSPVKPDKQIISIIKRIANNPTKYEKLDGTNETAKQIIANKNW